MKKISQSIKYQEQIDRNYQMFKQAIGRLVNKKSCSEEEQSYLYNRAKADLYNIDWDYNIYDPVGLEQAIETHEWSMRKDHYNQDRDYYDRIRLKS